MKRKEVYKFRFAERLETIEKGFIAPVVSDDLPVQESKDPNESFIRLVYTIDERTKLPIGDIHYLVTDDVNPALKEYVIKNLLFDTSGIANPPLPEGVPDDVAVALARDSREDTPTYIHRLNRFYDSNVDVMKRVSAQIEAERIEAERARSQQESNE